MPEGYVPWITMMVNQNAIDSDRSAPDRAEIPLLFLIPLRSSARFTNLPSPIARLKRRAAP
ncbi:hypothetical protein EKH55_3415 [Sinorhizobium alkalisoli]|nr:hypothetical protein EKH55_3415 [Sinorhizobium alkalisoli]